MHAFNIQGRCGVNRDVLRFEVEDDADLED